MIAWLVLLVLLVPAASHAATLAATTCSNVDIQTRIDAAGTGDTVTVPAGNCTWTTSVNISGKALTLTGAGVGLTNITDQSVVSTALNINASATNFVSISGFTFTASTNHATNGIVIIQGTQFDVAFRFHHNRLVQSATNSRGLTVYYVYGLVDHNDIVALTGSVQQISVTGGNIGGADGGYLPWRQPLTLGTNKAVYIEDNTFTHAAVNFNSEDVVDAYSGARLVLRYNTLVDAHFGFHGTDSGSIRSPVSFEIYNNTYNNDTTATLPAGRMRGGTGVIYSNTWAHSSSGTWNAFQLVNYRSCQPNTFSWNVCDGSNWELGSANLSDNASRTCSLTGNFRFDDATNEILAAEDGTHTKYFDGGGLANQTGGYPCRDQIGRGPGQTLEPLYEWSNTGATVVSYNLGDSGNCQGRGINFYILAGRDYINNGSTPKPGYTAYTYPHPLQGVAPAPDPPQGLHLAGPISNNGATLAWEPSTNANLAAYYLYRGTSSGVYNSVTTITAVSAAAAHSPLTRQIVSDLPAGTYYFAVSGVDTQGLEGAKSSEVPVVVTGQSTRPSRQTSFVSTGVHNATSANGTGVTSSALTLTAGSGMVAGLAGQPGATVSSFTGACATAWTVLPSVLATGIGVNLTAYYCSLVTAGSQQVVATMSASGAKTLYLQEIKTTGGLGIILDQNGRNTELFSPWESPILTTTYANELLWCFAAGNAGSAGDIWKPNNNFVLQDNVTDGSIKVPGAQAVRVTTAPGIYEVDWTTTVTTSAGVWLSTFRAAQ